MKSIVTMSMMVLLGLWLITWGGLSEAWAKGPGSFHATTSHITQPSATQGNSVTSSGNQGQTKTTTATHYRGRRIPIKVSGVGVGSISGK